MRILDWLSIAGGGLVVLGLTFAFVFLVYGVAVCGGFPDASLGCPSPTDANLALSESGEQKGKKLVTIELGNVGGRAPIPENAALPTPTTQ